MLYNIFVSFTGFDICLAKTYNNITEIARCLGTSSSSLKLYLRCKMAVTSIKGYRTKSVAILVPKIGK